MISPHLYWVLRGIPFLRLGETHYHPLARIEAMERERLAALPASIAAYQDSDMRVQHTITAMLESVGTGNKGIIDLSRACVVPSGRRVLRYPLLVDASVRNDLCERLRRWGLGPSIMYPAALPGIPGLEVLLERQGPFPEAESFAARILTLPTHGRVRQNDIENMRLLLGAL